MTKIVLQANNDQGKIPNFALPAIAVTPFFEQKTGQLAVIFDSHHSPIPYFYPNFHTYHALTLTRIMQEDFLWENNCYELFLGFDNIENSPYLEINFSPEGYFNLYHFDSYRTPQQMPPRRLTIKEAERKKLLNFYNVPYNLTGNMPAIFWQESLPNQQVIRDEIEKKFPLATDSYRLVMIVDLALLAELLSVKLSDKVWLNPCVVFKGEETELAYFAPQHANPPDFHAKKYWLRVN